MSAAVHFLPPSSRDAISLASRLGVPAHEIAIHTFPDGEIRVTVGPAASTTIIYASLDRPNEKLIALMFAAEALRRDGAQRLILLAPYLCYMRQDTAFHPGEAISQKVIGTMLAGQMDRIITVNAHLHRTPDLRTVFPGIEADDISAMPVIAGALQHSRIDPATILIGPDVESRPWISDLAGRLGLDYAVASKTRRGDRSVAITFPGEARIAGRPTLIVDDIVSSGGTMIVCAEALTTAGATAIDAVITHALFPEQSGRDMALAGIRSLRSTHSVPHASNAIPLDDLFADALRGEMKLAPLPETKR